MKTFIRLFLLVGCSMLGGLACGDDDDDGGGGSSGSTARRDGGDEDGGGRSGAGRGASGSGGSSGSSGSYDEDTLASDLSAAQVQEVCANLDQTAGLLGDVEAACQVEAYLLTFDEAECMSIVMQCNDNGETQLGLELSSLCADEGMELPGCEVTVGEMVACAETFSEFWASRTCAVDSLAEMGPDCGDDLADRCPILYGENSGTGGSGGSGGSGSTGSCSGVAPLCSAQGSSASCTLVDGCLWSSSSEMCTGVSRSCSLYTSATSCELQSGCSWTN